MMMDKPVPDPRIAEYIEALMYEGPAPNVSHSVMHRLGVEHGFAVVEGLIKDYFAAMREYDKFKNDGFYVGQTVEATGSYCWSLTEGKKYTVTNVQPEDVGPTFTFPIYVTVIGDLGKPVTGHTHRFRPVN